MGQLFGISGYLVVGCNFAPIKMVGESDGTCIHIAGVGVQRIDQPLPYAIQFVPYAGDERSQRLEQAPSSGLEAASCWKVSWIDPCAAVPMLPIAPFWSLLNKEISFWVRIYVPIAAILAGSS